MFILLRIHVFLSVPEAPKTYFSRTEGRTDRTDTAVLPAVRTYFMYDPLYDCKGKSKD